MLLARVLCFQVIGPEWPFMQVLGEGYFLHALFC